MYIIPWGVDAVQSNHFSPPEIDYRKGTAIRIAAQHREFMTARQPNGLKSEVILVGPEPGHGGKGLWIATNGFGHQRRLVCCILHGFDADHRALRKLIGMGRAIPNGKYVGQRRAAESIHQHAITSFGPGIHERLHGGDDAYADNHQFSRYHLATRQTHTGGAIDALDGLDPRIQAQIDSMVTMFLLEEA